MNHHCSDPSQLLTLRVKGCFPPFPSHYSWVEWPHPTWTLSSTAASCSWHHYRCCILLLNRREHPRFVDAYGQKTMSKARRIHNTFQSYTLGILPLSSNSEIKKRSFPCPGASFLISRANDLACKAHFLGFFKKWIRRPWGSLVFLIPHYCIDPQLTAHVSWCHACAVLYFGLLLWTRMRKWPQKGPILPLYSHILF